MAWVAWHSSCHARTMRIFYLLQEWFDSLWVGTGVKKESEGRVGLHVPSCAQVKYSLHLISTLRFCSMHSNVILTM